MAEKSASPRSFDLSRSAVTGKPPALAPGLLSDQTGAVTSRPTEETMELSPLDVQFLRSVRITPVTPEPDWQARIAAMRAALAHSEAERLRIVRERDKWRRTSLYFGLVAAGHFALCVWLYISR